MNRKLSLAFLAIVLLASGCVVNGGGNRRNYGDVTFAWSFYGLTCAQAGVTSVRISIPGESLENGGVYACTNNGYPGIVLHDFAPASYGFTIDGFEASGARSYTASGTFVVNGNILVNVDLTPLGQAPSWAYLKWSFPPEQGIVRPCEDRGIAYVDVQIDNGVVTRYNCTDGITNPGARSVLVPVGSHVINLWAVDNTNYLYYSATSTLTTSGNAQSQQEFTLGWAVGGTAFRWAFTNNTTAQTCAQSGTTTMYVTFRNPQTGQYLYGQPENHTTWDRIENICTQSYLYWLYLPPGTYEVYMRAVGPGVSYASNFQSPYVVTITAGNFPGEAHAQAQQPVQLFREQ
jgi:hypothetical protein